MSHTNPPTGSVQDDQRASKLLLGTSGALAVVVGGGGLLTFIGSLLNLHQTTETATADLINARYTAAIERLVSTEPESRMVGRAELQDIAARSDYYDDLVYAILTSDLRAGAPNPPLIPGTPIAPSTPVPGATPQPGASEQIPTGVSPAQANPEARQIVDILAGRKQRADPVVVNLSGVDLRQQNLAGADLSGETLRAADLSGSQLSAADLTNAELTGANLSATDLTGADLAGADLTGVNLSGADLRQAQNLTQTQLNGAIVDHTTLLPPDLTAPTAPSHMPIGESGS
jgi:hypothetical protein